MSSHRLAPDEAQARDLRSHVEALTGLRARPLLVGALPIYLVVSALALHGALPTVALFCWLAFSVVVTAVNGVVFAPIVGRLDMTLRPRGRTLWFLLGLGGPWALLGFLPRLDGGSVVAAIVVTLAVIVITVAASKATTAARLLILGLVVGPNLVAELVAQPTDRIAVVTLALGVPIGLGAARLLARVRASVVDAELRVRAGVEALERDREALRAANARLAFDATHDRLTGIPNRKLLQQELDTALEAGSGVGLLFLDLDNFKHVNDSLGHAAGDGLLRAVAARMTNAVGGDDRLVARIGGDEFVVLLRSPADAGAVIRVAETLLEVFAAPFTIDGVELDVGTSIGVVVARDTDTADSLYRLADVALYAAKEAGRSQFVFAGDDLRAERDLRIRTELALRVALDKGAIQPWFQPELDLLTGSTLAAEALARWVSGELVVPAGVFIAAAQRAGLTEALTLQTIDAIASWRLRHTDLEIGVNISTMHLPAIIERFANSERERPLAGVRLEIPEPELLTDRDRLIEPLGRVRELGASIVLDNFGTGGSSLFMLADLPIDGIKIDRRYVDRLITDVRVRELVTGLAEFGRRTGVTVIAEGVETPEQADFLLQVGITRAQGFLFAKAMDGEQFGAFVDAPPLEITLTPQF